VGTSVSAPGGVTGFPQKSFASEDKKSNTPVNNKARLNLIIIIVNQSTKYTPKNFRRKNVIAQNRWSNT
jgi:hypothetical protein